MNNLKMIFVLLSCHFVGDYLLQIDYLAKTKATNLYHMVIHCFLYCLPFAIMFGYDYRIYVLLISHFIVDNLKAKYNSISYLADQVLHLIILIIFYGVIR